MLQVPQNILKSGTVTLGCLWIVTGLIHILAIKREDLLYEVFQCTSHQDEAVTFGCGKKVGLKHAYYGLVQRHYRF